MAAETPVCDVGCAAPDFRLRGVDGRILTLADVRGPRGTLVMFLCNHCPYVQAVIVRIVRDVAELAACRVGIRALAAMPLPTEKRNEGQRDVPVQLQGVWVRPGDWLCADEDGVVVADRPLG